MTSRPPPRTSRTRFRPSTRTSRNSISGEAVKEEKEGRAARGARPGRQDTVLVPAPVPGWAGHVEQHQLSPLGPVDHHFVQLDSRVHAPHVRLVPGGTKEHSEAAVGRQSLSGL